MIYEYIVYSRWFNYYAAKVVLYNRTYDVATIIPLRLNISNQNLPYYYLNIPDGISKVKFFLVGAGSIYTGFATKGDSSKVNLIPRGGGNVIRLTADTNTSPASSLAESSGYILSDKPEYYNSFSEGYGKGGKTSTSPSQKIYYKRANYTMSSEYAVSKGDYCQCYVGTNKESATNLYNPSDGFIVVSYEGNTLFNIEGSKSQIYTEAGTYSFKVPYGVTRLKVILRGGGGGGGGGYYLFTDAFSYSYGGNGGNGATVVKTISVTPQTYYQVVVGAGGKGGSSNNLIQASGFAPNGNKGETSSFGNLASAVGGEGGYGVYAEFKFQGDNQYRGASGTNGANGSPQDKDESTEKYGLGGVGAGRDNNVTKGKDGESGVVLISWE